MRSRSTIPDRESTDVRALVEDLFRRSAGRLVSSLTRSLGARHLELAEEVVQDALVAALQKWPWSGVPERPESWLFRVARNRALDRLRRSGRWESELPDDEVRALAEAVERLDTDPPDGPGAPIRDDELAMLFMCAHPSLPADGAVALTLRTVGGLSTREIAAAFLVRESTMAQRLVRAKRTFAALDDPIEVPELPARQARVEKVLYLMFNEGYASTGSDTPIRAELCREAIRLAELLARHPQTTGPEVDALLALFLLQASRIPARTAADGTPIPLEAQARALWDRQALTRGLSHLDRARGDRVTPVHLEAGIAAEHAIAPDFESTSWERICLLYDRLMVIAPSPVVSMNRAVAVGMRDGPTAGLALLEGVEAGGDPLASGHALPATRAFLLERAGEPRRAREEWAEAARRATSDPVRRYLEGRAAAK